MFLRLPECTTKHTYTIEGRRLLTVLLSPPVGMGRENENNLPPFVFEPTTEPTLCRAERGVVLVRQRALMNGVVWRCNQRDGRLSWVCMYVGLTFEAGGVWSASVLLGVHR